MTMRTPAAALIAMTLALAGCQAPGIPSSAGLVGQAVQGRSLTVAWKAPTERGVQSLVRRARLNELAHYNVRLLVKDGSGNFVEPVTPLHAFVPYEAPPPVKFKVLADAPANQVRFDNLEGRHYRAEVTGVDKAGQVVTNVAIADVDLSGQDVEQHARAAVSVQMTMRSPVYDGKLTFELPSWASSGTVWLTADAMPTVSSGLLAAGGSATFEHLRAGKSYDLQYALTTVYGQSISIEGSFLADKTLWELATENALTLSGQPLREIASTAGTLKAAAADSAGNLWMASTTGSAHQIKRVAPNGDETPAIPLLITPTAIAIDPDTQDVWALTGVELMKISPAAPSVAGPRIALAYPPKELLIDGSHNVWAYGNNRVTRIDGATSAQQTFTVDAAGTVTDLTLDAAGNAWASYYKLSGGSYSIYLAKVPAGSDTPETGLLVHANATTRLPDMTIAADHTGDIWVNTSHVDYHRYTVSNKRFHPANNSVTDFHSPAPIRSMVAASNGYVYALASADNYGTSINTYACVYKVGEISYTGLTSVGEVVDFSSLVLNRPTDSAFVPIASGGSFIFKDGAIKRGPATVKAAGPTTYDQFGNAWGFDGTKAVWYAH